MKYGIISLNIYEKDNNWGSILQSYALQEYLKSINIDVKIINYKPKVIKFNEAKYPILKYSPFKLKRFLKLLPSILKDWKNFVNRDKKFQSFINSYYSCTKKMKEKDFQKNDFDGFIVGSDIVWNDEFWNGLEKVFFCDFDGMKEKNNIAYAPSMATNGFKKENEDALKILLRNFNYISVREKSKVDYISSFTKLDVINVLDPTLLLNFSDYKKFVLNDLINEPYLLVYCVDQNYYLLKYAYEYCIKNNLKLVTIKCCPGKRYNDIKSINYDAAGIEEWITLIKNANFVLTTSFHACIFSIIFKKRFYAIYHKFGKSKIVDLLDTLSLSNFSSKIEDIDMNYIIDYDSVYKKIDELKINSISYLNKSLHREEE